MAFARHTPNTACSTGRTGRPLQAPTRTTSSCSHPPDLGERGIGQGPVEAPLTGPALRPHPRSTQCLDRDHPMLLCERRRRLVQHLMAYRRCVGVHPTDTGLGAPPPIRRCPPGSGGVIVGPTCRAVLRCNARSRDCALARDFGAGTRAISVPSGAATTSRSFTPTSTPTTGCVERRACAGGVPTARCTSTWNEHIQRPRTRVTVADRIRAVPASIRRASLRVDSCALIRPSRGSVMWWRSASTRIVPVVNRTDLPARCLDLNRGNPTGAPARSPRRDRDHASRPRASASNPLLYASFEFSPTTVPPRACGCSSTSAAQPNSTPAPGSAPSRPHRNCVRRPADPSRS